MVKLIRFILLASLYVLILIIPLSTKYIVTQPFAITYINVFSVLFIFVYLIAIITKTIKFEMPKHSLLIGIGIFILGMLWAFYVTPNPRDGVGLLTSRLFQPLLVGYGVWLLLQNRIINAEHLLYGFLAAIIIPTVIGIGQILSITPSHNIDRVTSIYEWPNTFARIQAFLLLIIYPILFFKNKWRMFFIIVWMIGLAILITTKSYNGIASFFTALVFASLFIPNISKKIKISFVTIFLLATVVLISNPSKLIPQWEVRIGDSQYSRLEFWLIAEKVFHEKPWTGIGIKGWEIQYTALLNKYMPFWPPYNWVSSQPHSLVFDALMKGGIPTLIGVLVFMSTLVLIGFRLALNKNRLGIGILAAGIMLFLFGAIDDPIWSDDIMPYIFIMAGLGIFLLNQKSPQSEN